MIARVWHGWTAPENADRYEEVLMSEIFPGIFAKNIRGLHGIELLRRAADDEVEFVTIMRFSSIDDIIAFVGEDYERSYVPAAAREVLKRFDERSVHYELRHGPRP
jgi:heme-degrading monooxygenase HmoA